MTVSMLTLTVRHKKHQPLSQLLTAMESAYTNVQGTQAYKDLRNQYNAKFVRVLEITNGKNGWHPHYHIAVIHDKGAAFGSYSSELENAWCKNLEKKGLLTPKKEVAVNIVENANNEMRAWYLTKASGISSLEITNGRHKVAMGENMGVWQMHALAVSGSKDAKVLWNEYEIAMIGKRLISPSRGLEDFFGVSWKGDQQVAGDEFTEFADNLHSDPLCNVRVNFVGGISDTMWKQILEKKLVRQVRQCREYDELVKFCKHNEIRGHVLSFEEIIEFNNMKEEIKAEMHKALDALDRRRFDLLEKMAQAGDMLPAVRNSLFKMSMNMSKEVVGE
jgi:hypothetical protein